jgi:hypothetical protein
MLWLLLDSFGADLADFGDGWLFVIDNRPETGGLDGLPFLLPRLVDLLGLPDALQNIEFVLLVRILIEQLVVRDGSLIKLLKFRFAVQRLSGRAAEKPDSVDVLFSLASCDFAECNFDDLPRPRTEAFALRKDEFARGVPQFLFGSLHVHLNQSIYRASTTLKPDGRTD